MKRIILFSNFSTLPDKNRFLETLFPEEIKEKKFGYMPPDGMKMAFYAEGWKESCKKYDAEFTYIDITQSGQQKKILDSNILLITGGNTFGLLDNLRKNNLFEILKTFTQKSTFVIAGFSAGAVLLTPTIRLAQDEDENSVGVTNFEGLGLVDFEIYPHYTEQKNDFLDEYSQKYATRVMPIRDDEFFVFDL